MNAKEYKNLYNKYGILVTCGTCGGVQFRSKLARAEQRCKICSSRMLVYCKKNQVTVVMLDNDEDIEVDNVISNIKELDEDNKN